MGQPTRQGIIRWGCDQVATNGYKWSGYRYFADNEKALHEYLKKTLTVWMTVWWSGSPTKVTWICFHQFARRVVNCGKLKSISGLWRPTILIEFYNNSTFLRYTASYARLLQRSSCQNEWEWWKQALHLNWRIHKYTLSSIHVGWLHAMVFWSFWVATYPTAKQESWS